MYEWSHPLGHWLPFSSDVFLSATISFQWLLPLLPQDASLAPPHIQIGILTDFILYRSCGRNHSCCKPICVTTLSCLEVKYFTAFFLIHQLLPSFHPFFSDAPLTSERGDWYRSQLSSSSYLYLSIWWILSSFINCYPLGVGLPWSDLSIANL